MLTFQPFEENGLLGYRAQDDETKTTAQCSFALDGMYVTILGMDCPQERADLCEGLLRSALSYAANRNAFVARADAQSPAAPVLRRLGFTPRNDMLEAEIPDVLLGGCKGCKSC